MTDVLRVWEYLPLITIKSYFTLIRIGLSYPSIHNSFIANKRTEVKPAQHMMHAI